MVVVATVEEPCDIVGVIGQAGIAGGLARVLAVGAAVVERCSRMLRLDPQTASWLAPRVHNSKGVVMKHSSWELVLEQVRSWTEAFEARFEAHS